MSRPEYVTLTNMVMIRNGDSVLVEDRVDPHWNGIVFPGGHVEPGESFVQSAIREVREETGLEIANLRLCGIKQFPCQNGTIRYIVIFFRTETFSGTLKSSSEGKVFWVRRSELDRYRKVPGFDAMLEIFENDALNENYYPEENSPNYINL